MDHIYFPAATDPAKVIDEDIQQKIAPEARVAKVIDEDIQQKIAPEARVVAFFITSDGTLVADSTTFSLKAECRGPGVCYWLSH